MTWKKIDAWIWVSERAAPDIRIEVDPEIFAVVVNAVMHKMVWVPGMLHDDQQGSKGVVYLDTTRIKQTNE